jgi:hypothetical protein
MKIFTVILRRSLKNAWPRSALPLAVMLFCAASVNLAQAGLPAATRWADPSTVQLDVEFPGEGYHATWDMARCDCGDLLIRSELSVPGSVESGESILVGGRVVLSRGFNDKEEELLGASLDAPALMMQLALSLLERVAPAGPSALVGTTAVDFEEPLNPIHLDSGGAAGSFWAPWSVSGTINAPDESQRQFDFHFRFSTGNPGEELIGSMRLWGAAEYAQKPFPVDPSSSLSDWVISWREEADPAMAASADIQTLESLRKLLRQTR